MMLVEFSVENFRSFKKKARLSMVATSDSSLAKNVITNAMGSGLNLLKSVVIYGANASGKSNLIRAIKRMDFLVGTSAKDGASGRLSQSFLLEEISSQAATAFEICFLSAGTRCVYGFSINANGLVKEEYLYVYPYDTNRKNTIFERTYKEEGDRTEFRFGPSWQGSAKPIQDATRNDALVVSIAKIINNKNTSIVTDWFVNNLRDLSSTSMPEGEAEFTGESVAEVEGMRTEVLKFLRRADTGIMDLHIRDLSKDEIDGMFSSMPTQLAEVVRGIISELPENKIKKVETMHPCLMQDGTTKPIIFDLRKQESAGTQRIYAIAGPWLTILSEGSVITADEFELRLHENLSAWLLEMLHSDKYNSKGAQAVLTTHSSALLDSGHFRRDQVWITDKDSSGATQLYSLAEFKGVRKEAQLRKSYLSGRYGGVPILETL